MVSPQFGTFQSDERQSPFGPPTQMQPGLAAHLAQQAAQHAQRNPTNPQAQQQAAAWAAHAGAPAAPLGAQGAPAGPAASGAYAMPTPMPQQFGFAPAPGPYTSYEPPTPPASAQILGTGHGFHQHRCPYAAPKLTALHHHHIPHKTSFKASVSPSIRQCSASPAYMR